MEQPARPRFPWSQLVIFLFLVLGVILITSTLSNRSNCGVNYIVQTGDTLGSIAQACGVSLDDLQRANPQLQPPYTLVPGQVLTIPAKAATSAPAATQAAGIPVTGSQARLTLAPTSGGAGTQVTVNGSGFSATTEYDLTVSAQGRTPETSLRVVSNASGVFTQVVTIPGYALVGSVWQIAVPDPVGGGQLAFAQFQVTGASASSGNPPPADVPSANPPPASAPSVIATPGSSGSPGIHVVQPGDTLSAIAQAYGVTLDAILAANPSITNPNAIVPGQQIVIPGAGAPASSPVAPTDPGPKGGEPDAGATPAPPTAIPPTAAPAPRGRLTLNPATGPAGSAVAVSGSEFAANTRVNLGVGQAAAIASSQELVTDAAGAFRANLTIPANAGPGSVWTVSAAPAGGAPVSVQFQVSAQPPTGLYTVRGGDTMAGIASQFNTEEDALVRANADVGPSSLLHTGQQLYIPGTLVNAGGRMVYIVTRGDTLMEISRARGATLADLKQANLNLVEPFLIYPGDHVLMP